MRNGTLSSPDTGIDAQVAPFAEGDVVRIKGENHLGLHRVESSEWFDRTKPGVPHYWLCECTEIRDQIDWSKIPAGATGIVTHSSWRGAADHLEVAQ
jgi:hypothetical protein